MELVLDFERPIVELYRRIDSLRNLEESACCEWGPQRAWGASRPTRTYAQLIGKTVGPYFGRLD